MIKKILVSGCSFTESNSWANHLAKILNLNLINVAKAGAGNDYIGNSIIDELSTNQYTPKDTLVLVMWSGTGRKDLRTGIDYWNILNSYTYRSKTHTKNFNGNMDLDKCYVFSGGLSNSWTTNNDTKKLFQELYKSSDPFSLCKDSLVNFINLENFLKVNGYKYKFTSFQNYWSPLIESTQATGDYSIGWFGKNISLYKNFNFSDWFFVNENKDCLFEYSESRKLIDHTAHPTTQGHQMFAENVVLPAIKDIL